MRFESLPATSFCSMEHLTRRRDRRGPLRPERSECAGCRHDEHQQVSDRADPGFRHVDAGQPTVDVGRRISIIVRHYVNTSLSNPGQPGLVDLAGNPLNLTGFNANVNGGGADFTFNFKLTGVNSTAERARNRRAIRPPVRPIRPSIRRPPAYKTTPSWPRPPTTATWSCGCLTPPIARGTSSASGSIQAVIRWDRSSRSTSSRLARSPRALSHRPPTWR